MAAKSCSVCSNPWNREDHLPVALPECGHSFCRSCLAVMYRNDKCIKCPTCRKVYKDIRPEDLPANFALLDLIESNVQDGPAPNPGSPDVPPSGSPTEPPKGDPAPSPGSPDVPPRGSSEPPKGDPVDEPSSGPSKRGIGKGLLIGCTAVVGGVGAVAAAPAVLTAVGFTSAGIAAGSWAASMMSIAAGLNGGGVAAGGLIATLQSVGAAGLGATGVAAVGAAGGVAGAGVAAVRMKSRL